MEDKKQENIKYQDPEGLQDESGIGLKEYPLDDLLIRPETRTVFEVIKRINENRYIMDPDFQRDFVWDDVKQSRLIESALMRIPLPVFYLAEQQDGKIIVVDGLQRLMTFKRFLNNELILKDVAEPIKKKKYKDLSQKLQNRIEDTSLVLYLIDSKVPERARLDIFERVNSGIPLTRQQMRNSIYMGAGTRWLKKASLSKIFLKVTTESLDPKKMRDREFINRFCGFYLFGEESYQNIYKADMDSFLAEAIKKMNKMNLKELDNLFNKFELSMKNNYSVFDESAFRKIKSDGNRSVINAALFDVYSVLMADYDESFILKSKKKIKDKFFELLNNDDFFNSITLSTGDSKKVNLRFKLIRKSFKEIENA